MIPIELYLKTLRENSLFIFCNDCTSMPSFINSNQSLVATAFAGLVNTKNGFNKVWFLHHLKDNGIKHFIIAGHSDCKIIPFLLNDSCNNVNWDNTKQYLKSLQTLYGEYSSLSCDSKLLFIKSYLRFQVQHVQDFLIESGISREYSISIKGITINEKDCTVEEIEM